MNKYDHYYPRPLLQRDSFLSLNGEWLLNGKAIEVPFPPESEASGYKGDLKEIIYVKEFNVPEKFSRKEDKVILHFGAVDQLCNVYLNGEFICHHEGGYLPFSADVTACLKEENTLKVEVTDTLDPLYPYGKQAKEPSGIWYTQVSGIWQSVWLEAYPRDGIDTLEIHTDMDTLKLHIDSDAERFTIEFPGYIESFDQHEIEIKIAEPHLWSIDDPYLYDLKISTGNDTVRSYFALRKTELRKVNGHCRFYLNDEPVFINGLLDQGYFKKGIYTPEDPAEYESDVLNMKELGFNALRKHIKVEAEAFYYYCDKHGMLVMQDMVNNGEYKFFRDTLLATLGISMRDTTGFAEGRKEFWIRHSKETIEHLYNHPCVIAYTLFNEGWGQFESDAAYTMLKSVDDTRLFDSTSGWFPQNRSDFDSLHIYFRTVELFPKERPLLLSEFGGYSYPVEGHRSTKKTYGYGACRSKEELTEKIVSAYEKMVIPAIKNGLCGSIYTQVSDVEDEINGMMTYDREVLKVDAGKMKELSERIFAEIE